MKRISELFKCPQCFNHRLQEVRINVTVTTAVEMLGGAGDVQYGEQTTRGRHHGTISVHRLRMGCSRCDNSRGTVRFLTSPESPCRP